MNLEVRDLYFSYSPPVPVLHNVSMSANKGEITALVGQNGSGKSTLLKCINGIHVPQKGQIIFEKKDVFSYSLKERARIISYVPQAIPDSLSMKVFDVVLLGRRPYIRWGVGMEDRKIVYETLELLGLEDLTFRSYNELSGGQKQKVLICRALAQKPRLLIMDEPTSSLDLRHQLEILGQVREFARAEHLCVILTAHDLNLVMNFADRMVMLRDGMVSHDGTVDDILTPENVREVFDVKTHIGRHEGSRYITPLMKE
jgi:iron complex transport system ATP-binding protein